MGRDRYLDRSNKEQGIWMNYQFEFDKDLGTDRISKGNLKGTPVFFTSMLSGQRALDNGSRDRLVWHINQALSE